MGTITFEVDSLKLSDLDSNSSRLHCFTSERSFSFLITADNLPGNLRGKGFVFDRINRFYYKPLRDLPEVMRTNPVLFNAFETVRIGVRGVPCILTETQDAEDSDDLGALLWKVTDIGPNDRLFSDHIDQINKSCVYALPASFIEELELYFNHFELKHSCTALCEWIAAKGAGTGDLVVAVLSEGLVEIVVACGGDIRFYNQFRWRTAQDIGYFVSAVAEQFDLEDQWQMLMAGPACTPERVTKLKTLLNLENRFLTAYQEYNPRTLDLEIFARCVS